MNFDLGRMRAVMAVLGHPERGFPAIHVAGTNGKGSVCALLSSALTECGLRTGLYTSPHLERLTERFRVGAREITETRLASLSSRVFRAFRRARIRPTQFEFLTAVAFLHFADESVDVAVIETGLGGRLDATNVLEHVAVSVITNIGLDHTEWLGKTPARIAAEKAGILRSRVPAVTGAGGEALNVIARIAGSVHAPLRVIAPSSAGPRAPRVALAGPHQRTNAAVARAVVEALRRLGWSLPDRSIRRGFGRARWPGRFERFTLKAGENRITWLLDGAHNVPAAEALRATLADAGIRRVELLFGALRDKDYAGIASALAPMAASVTAVRVNSNRAAAPATLAGLSPWRKRAVSAGSVEAALEAMTRRAPDRPVLVTGSLYLVGSVRAWLRRQSGVTMRDKGRFS